MNTELLTRKLFFNCAPPTVDRIEQMRCVLGLRSQAETIRFAIAHLSRALDQSGSAFPATAAPPSVERK